MNGYYLIYLCICILTFWGVIAETKEKRNLAFYIGCFLLVLMTVCQDYASTADSRTYYQVYEWISGMNLSQLLAFTIWEPAFVFLCKFVHLLGMGPRMLYLFVAIIGMVPVFVRIYREGKVPAIGLFAFVALGFFKYSMTFYRQACAIGILFLSWRFVRERKLIPFALTVLVAALFHRTAAAFAIMYFVVMLPVRKGLVFGAAAVSVACALLGTPIMHFLNTLLRVPYDLEPDGGLTMYISLWLLVALLLWLKGKELNTPRLKLPFMMLLVGATLQSVSFTESTFARLVWYFTMSLVVLVPELYDAVFCRKDNALLQLAEKWLPAVHKSLIKLYDIKWFRLAGLIAMFVVLLVWFRATLMGYSYAMAPMG